jgi:TIR domain
MAVSSRIFISYRRTDSPAYAGRLFDQLSARFGESQVFMDVDTLEPGVDFVQRIEESLGSADVLIAVIGRGWASAVDESGHRRLDDPHDFVRIEVGGALRRNIRVIPVLVAGATMPTADELPDDLDALTRRNGLEIFDTDWRSGTERLFVAIEHVLDLAPAQPPPPSGAGSTRSDEVPATGEPGPRRRSRKPLWIVAGVAALLAVTGIGAAAMIASRDDGGESATGTVPASKKSTPTASRTVGLVPYLVGPRPNDPPSQGRCFVPFSPEAAVQVRGARFGSDWIQCGDFPGGDPRRATGTYRFAGLTLPAGSRLVRFRGLAVIDEFSSSSQRGSRVTWTVFYRDRVLCADTIAWTASLPTPTMFSCDARDIPGDADLRQLRIVQKAELASGEEFWAGFLHPKIVVTSQD